MKLWDIKDGRMALVLLWIEGEHGLESHRLPCTVLRHAKNGRSVRVSGESFGAGCWLPADCDCQPFLSKAEFNAEIGKRFESVTIDGVEYWKGIRLKNAGEKKG